MENNASAITKWFTEKATEFQDLTARMDEDYKIWDMDTSSIANFGKEHGSEIELVSNELRVNCDYVQSILSSVDIQIQVKMAEAEGLDKRAEIGKLERLFYYMLEQGDQRLRRLLLPSLIETSNWHALVRGWRAARILNYKKDGKIIIDYMPLDPRYLVYDMGGDGLIKVGYKIFKSQSALKSEWGVEELGKGIEVIDYWEYEEPGRYSNAVVCKDRFLKEPETLKIRSMPFSIVPISTRAPLADEAGAKLKTYGESIFASARGIHAIRNRVASIVINHANLMANQPLINYRTELGRSIPATAMFNVPGEVIELTKGENELVPSPMKEVSPTVVSILAWLSSQIETTILPKFGLEQPPASGTRFALAAEQSNKIFNPQLRSLNHFLEDICRLIEEQLIDGGIKVKFQSLFKNKYMEVEVAPVDLKKPHIIKVESTYKNPWEAMDTAQIAQMLEQLGLPKVWIWENILKIQDPKLIQDLLALEVYEHSPEGMMKRAVDVLMDKGYIFEAQKLIEVMDKMEAQGAGEPGPPGIPTEEVVPAAPPLEERPPEMPEGGF